MSDWIEHNGGPQPVADDVWVEVADPIKGTYLSTAIGADWGHAPEYRILNQHLIDSARLEGIRLGLEAATWWLTELANAADQPASRALLAGASRLRDLNADNIGLKAVLENLRRVDEVPVGTRGVA